MSAPHLCGVQTSHGLRWFYLRKSANGQRMTWTRGLICSAESGRVSMKAHKVLDAIDGLKSKGAIDSEIADLISEKLSESQKFEFDFGVFPVLTEEEMSRQISSLNLPYPLCYFSIPTVGGVLARDHHDCVLIQPFMQMGERVGVLPPEMPLILDKIDGSLCCRSTNQEILDEWQNPSDKGVIAIVGLVSLVVRGLAVLNCNNVELIENQAPQALNKKRLRSGKRPIFSFKTLHIKTTGSQEKGSKNSAPLKIGPRLHMRQGHIRRLPTGVTTWVQSCMVGSASIGVVYKDYKVT